MEQKIVKLIAEKLNKKVDEVKMESRLVEDLGADSLDVVELVMSFEDEFGITLPDEDVAKLKTIKDIVDYISNLKK
jgi:acyl carrier protein